VSVLLQPLNPTADDLIYADPDYKDLYDYGPVSYQQASKEAAEKKKLQAVDKSGGRAR
jgi:hypothetical protein